MFSVAFLTALVTMAAPPAAATNDLCGSSVSSNLELDEDLSCVGDGLIVAADGITIRLNGHTIMGPGPGSDTVGIRIAGRDEVSVSGPGVITNFRTGVLIEGGSDDIVVKRISAVENGLPVVPPVATPVSPNDGIHVTMSSNVVLERNLLMRNGDDGINVNVSTGVRVVKNVVDDNGHDGIRLDLADGNVIARNFVVSHDQIFGGTPVGCGIELFGSKDNRIEENYLLANTNGIRLRIIGTSASTGNEVEQNTVDGTGAELGGRRGIHVRDVSTGNEIEENRVSNYSAGIRLGDPGTPVGNTFEENRLRRNVCGVNGTTEGNTFDDNKFRDNGADFCPPLPPSYLQLEKVSIEVETEEGGLEINVEIRTDGRIPRDGSGGAFGYAVLTGGFNNVLVLVTHLGIDDSEFEDPVTGFHTHVLDLMSPTGSCGGFDAEVDISASMANPAFDPGYRFKVRGREASIQDVPTSDLADDGVETVASFTVTPVFAAGALTNLCVDVVDTT